jgi:glycine cleavage system H protein
LGHQKNEMNMTFPDNLKYTKEHEWVRVTGNTAQIGITEFAQSELGDIVYVDIETVGQTLAQNEIFGSVEAVKTVSDLYMPVSGKITAFNEELNVHPELVNKAPYEGGWMISCEMSDPSELDGLMTAAEYAAMTGH